MNALTQMWTATALGLSAIPQRLGSTIVTVLGIATVVAVMTSILAIGAGVRRFVDVVDQPDRAVILSGSTPSEFAGAFTPADVATVAGAPGVKMSAGAKPMVQPLAAVPVQLVRRKDGSPSTALLRGTGRIGDAMNQASMRVTSGRMYETGHRELVVGKAAHDQYVGLDIGDQVSIHGFRWTVVGIYENGGGIDENALAGDVDMVRADFRSPTYQSIGVQLASASDFDRFRDAVMSTPQLNVQVKRLTDYYHEQMRQLRTLFDFVGIFVGGLMSLGAICGAVTTLYAAVDARTREIATLRAIGFGDSAVVVSIMMEAVALAIPGALLGLAAAAVAFGDQGIVTGGVAFRATITPDLALTAAAVATGIGLLGGLAPAVRAARMPVAEALRAT